MDAAAANDIEFVSTPTGFSVRASLSSYSSIPLVMFLSIWTGGFIYFATMPNATANVAVYESIAGNIFLLLVTVIFWWAALIRAVGTQTVTLDSQDLRVSVGIGLVRYARRFDQRDIVSIVESEGVIGYSETGPALQAIVFHFRRPTQFLFLTREKFAFGHFLTRTQRAFIIHRIQEHIRTAT